MGDGQEGVGQAFNAIAVAHPDLHGCGQTGKKRIVLASVMARDRNRGGPILALMRRRYLTTQRVGQQLKSIADTKHGHVLGQHAFGQSRRA